MKIASVLIFILSAFVCPFIASCTSVPKPKTSPEDEAAATFKARGAVYLEICETECRLPGLVGSDETAARAAKVEKVASLTLTGEIPPDAVSNFEAANDFANRHNRAMFELARTNTAAK
jgi:hypothetical protein